MNAQALKRRMPENERIDIMARSAQRLQRLTENILDVARIENKTLKLNPALFNLIEKIRDVIANMDNGERQVENEINNQKKGYHFSIENHQIIFDPKDEPIMIHADPIRIFQVISNLLKNALLHSTKGSTIWISAEKSEERATVTVRDSGPGISQDVFSELFTKPSIKSDRGFGLGLYICRNIVDAHGGQIGAENKDQGSTFWFSIPIKPQPIISSE
jgi:signal transduction histidine kinase